MRFTKLIAAALLFTLCGVAAEPVIERVFGPETPTGPYKHPASFTELANGDLYLVYYGGAEEYAIQTGVYGARYSAAAKKWSAPKVIALDPFRSVGNGVVWQAPDGVVSVSYTHLDVYKRQRTACAPNTPCRIGTPPSPSH